MTAPSPIRHLTEFDRLALERHYLLLRSEDRRLRFGTVISDRDLRGYVDRIDFGRDAVFAATDEELEIVAAAHLAHNGDDGELGLSVLPEHRRRGIGAALLARTHTHARNLGLRLLFVHCLTENAAMMRIARRLGMRIVSEGLESDAYLQLEPADAASWIGEVFEQASALFDYALVRQLAASKAVARAWHAPRRGTDGGREAAPEGGCLRD